MFYFLAPVDSCLEHLEGLSLSRKDHLLSFPFSFCVSSVAIKSFDRPCSEFYSELKFLHFLYLSEIKGAREVLPQRALTSNLSVFSFSCFNINLIFGQTISFAFIFPSPFNFIILNSGSCESFETLK